MAETSAPAVVEYLTRLEGAARLLPPELRAELLGQVREHLADLEANGLDEAGLRTALERFGTPEQLVAAEAEQAGLAYAPAVPAAASAASTAPCARSAWGALELLTVLLVLLGGFVVPVVLPLVGMVLSWASPRWSRGTKVGTSLLLLSPLLVLGIGVATLLPGPRTVTVNTADGPVEVEIPDQVPGETAPQAGGGFWDSAHPVLWHPGAIVPVWLGLVLAGVVGSLAAGVWLALAGREARR